MTLNDRIKHVFHVLSNVRPLVWMCIYLCLIPLFAFLYWLLPDSQFRIPDGSGSDYGSWIYYSIVTITTLGFGDYTPCHAWAQAFTAIEVGCGLVVSGLFLNAVGSMKSEIDVTAEIERQRQLHKAQETDKLRRSTPAVLHCLNTFLDYCRIITTPVADRAGDPPYNPDFTEADLADMYQPSGLPGDGDTPAVVAMLRAAHRCSLCLDSLQTRIDTDLWPGLVEKCFTFVANCQMFTTSDRIGMSLAAGHSKQDGLRGDKGVDGEVGQFVREQAALAEGIEKILVAQQ